ncbi:DUF6297 family protein [Streptomyces zhihengii]
MSTGTRPGGAASPTGRDGTDTGAGIETGTGDDTDTGTGNGTGNDTDTGTADVLRFLVAVRGAHRARRRRSAAFAAYLLLLFGGVWGVPVLLAGARLARSGAGHDPVARPLLQFLPLWSAALMALCTLLVVRSAAWRGPVVVDGATVSWLLPQPVARGPLLLPRLASSAAVGGLLGTLSGGALGHLVAAASGTPWPQATAAGAWAGLGTALTGTALGAVSVRHERRPLRGRRAWSAVCHGIVAVLGLLSVVALTSGLPGWAATAAAWLLPWGWAAQPLAAAAAGTAPYWWAATALWAAAVGACVLWAVRAVPEIPAESLRLRATVADRVSASLFTLDLRRTRSVIHSVHRRGPVRPAPLPAPRVPWLVMPWRDALALARAPGRLGWGCVWSALSTAALVQGAERPGSAMVASAVAVWALYLAAAQFAEPARLESDDVRRGALLPYTAGALALWHALVPTVLLAATTTLGMLVCAVVGRWTPGLAPVAAAVPAAVGAALVGAYRGPVPFHLLLGAQTPMGDTAPVQTAVWYLRGLLALMAVAVPVVGDALAAGGAGPSGAGWLLVCGAGGLFWAHRTARRLQAG